MSKLNGYVGYGMLDAAVCGEIFTSPGPPIGTSIMLTKAVDAGKGVLLIVLKSQMEYQWIFEMAGNGSSRRNNCKTSCSWWYCSWENSTYTVGRE